MTRQRSRAGILGFKWPHMLLSATEGFKLKNKARMSLTLEVLEVEWHCSQNYDQTLTDVITPLRNAEWVNQRLALEIEKESIQEMTAEQL